MMRIVVIIVIWEIIIFWLVLIMSDLIETFDSTFDFCVVMGCQLIFDFYWVMVLLLLDD